MNKDFPSIRTVADVYDRLDADVVEFVDKDGMEVPDEQLADNRKVLDIRRISAGIYEVTVK